MNTPWRRRGRLRLMLLGILLLGALLALSPLFVRFGPSFEGKSLNYWFNQLPLTFVSHHGHPTRTDRLGRAPWQFWRPWGGHRYGNFEEPARHVEQAFHAMGTNALPLLLRKLEGKRSRLRRCVEAAEHKVAMRTSIFPSALCEREQAVSGLLCVELPPEYVRQLSALTNSVDTWVVQSAQYVLDHGQRTCVSVGSGAGL